MPRASFKKLPVGLAVAGLLFAAAAPGPAMKIEVRTVYGKVTELKVRPSDTVRELKEKIREKEDIPVKRQRLVFDGIPLKDTRKLESYDIHEGDAIALILGPASSEGDVHDRRVKPEERPWGPFEL